MGNPEHYTEETQEQMYRLQECGGKIIYGMPQEDSYSVVIDAVFGVGLSRKVEGRYRQVIEQMNRMRGTKFAVDIPSGLSATTGCIPVSYTHLHKKGTGQIEQMSEMDGKFHKILYEASNSRILEHVLTDFHKYVQLARTMSIEAPEDVYKRQSRYREG